MGMTAFDTGMALLPGAIATAASMVIIGRLMPIVDPRILTRSVCSSPRGRLWLGDLNQYSGVGDIFLRESSRASAWA